MNKKNRLVFGIGIILIISFFTSIASWIEIAKHIVTLLPLLILMLVVIIPILLIVYSLSKDKTTESSVSSWVKIPSISPDKLTKSLDVDYANPSVHYDIRRLSDDSYHHTYPTDYKKGRFTIDDKRIKLRNFIFHADDIQWFGRYKNSNSVRLSVNVDNLWYRINLMPVHDEDNFYKKIFECIPEKLKRSKYLNRPDVSSFEGTLAHTTQQNLQGIFEDIDAVELYITPLWLVILLNGTVIEQHFMDDIEDIRSIKHPTHINDDMLLISFSIGDYTLMYASEDSQFATRLSDATRSGFDKSALRKKKTKESEQ